jgi:hypothetical protein
MVITGKSLFKFCFCKRKGSVLGSGKAMIPGIATLFQELLQQTGSETGSLQRKG